jgi:hypothetical protein
MSKFLKIDEMQISDQHLLVTTLGNDMKFRGKDGQHAFAIESYDAPVHLFGVAGDQRKEMAEVVIRRQFVGRAANDMGFARQESGNFAPIISEFDRGYYNSGWTDTLAQKYGERKYEFDMYQNGFTLESKVTQADGSTAMEFTRMGGL